MHPRVFAEFERICTERQARGSVLEVGAFPSDLSLLCMRSLADASEKVGINLDGPHEFRDFKILQGNANAMTPFPDERFDVVLCNATLEHDKFFWKSLAEIKRVTRPGGLIVLGVPGYLTLKAEQLSRRLLQRLPLIRYFNAHPLFGALFESTLTFEIHQGPGDYYRFSRQAVEEVFFDDMTEVESATVMVPPRIIAAGRKPAR